MARPIRKGLDYFPLDTHFMSDRKIQRLAQRYGCNGICIYLAILCEIYGGTGYYARYDSDFCFDIGFTTGQDETLVKDVIGFCVQIRLFDSELMEYRQILSSVGIQQRFEEISRRTAVRIDTDINLLAPRKLSADKNGTTAPHEEVNVTETTVTAAKTTDHEADAGVIATGTGVSTAKTPVNINGNINKNTTTQHGGFYGNQSSNDHGEAARRAEILRMAQEATKGC